MELVEGAIVANRFRVNRMLGRGGMGSVWHATHLGLDIPCAVKFIEGEFAALPEAQARFEREAKAAAQLRSPHVVQILDHGISEGRPYIAMELLDGEDLGKRLIRVGRLSPTETGTVIAQVCRALTKAHSLGIVHRDLKPDNIFLVRDDDREIAKVLDFGIAKSNAHGIDGSNTKTGAMLGTPYYMSPEQAQGTKAVDYRSDLWSLAVIVFQCMTGRLPFESEALGDLLVKIIVNEMPIPSHYGPVPAGFDQWWAKAAARHADQRYQSAKEFGESLQQLLSHSVTDVMSAGSVRAAIGGPVPGMAQTPQPGHAPFGNTPASAMAQSVVAGHPQHAGAPAQHPQGVNATTGAPIARTYSGMNEGVETPKKKNPAVVFAGVGGAVALVGVVALVAFAGAGKGNKDKDTKGGATGGATSVVAAPVEAPKPPEPVKPEPAKTTEPAKTAEPAASAEPTKSPETKTAAKTEEPKTTRRKDRETKTAAPPPTGKPAPTKAAEKDFGF